MGRDPPRRAGFARASRLDLSGAGRCDRHSQPRRKLNMAKPMAVLFGVVFLVIGILGFVPAVTKDEMLLGIFHVNTAHNAVHLLTGVVALFCGMSGFGAARVFFKIFGLIYAAVAILGFLNPGDSMLLGLIANNTADTWLHVVIAVVSLLLGFMPASAETA
jgi:hypothetical protein